MLPQDKCIINIENQTMQVTCIDGFTKEYTISSAKNGVGNEKDSYKTPIGIHSICEKIGADLPMYSIFTQRLYTGLQCYNINDPECNSDLILSRILRLQGEEPGINHNTYARYIYIHGTNREDLLGTPASHGCIRMANADIIELFDRIRVGVIVDIQKDAPNNIPIISK